jgi:hypothetical protein
MASRHICTSCRNNEIWAIVLIKTDERSKAILVIELLALELVLYRSDLFALKIYSRLID